MSIFLEIMVSILWEKLGNKPKLETAIARWKCLFQAYMPHSSGLTSWDDSDRRLWLCHVCFSTLLSQHQSVCTRRTKIKKGPSQNQVEAPALKVGEARDKIFQALDWRNFDWIKPLQGRFAQLMSVWKHYKFMAIEKLQITPNCENRDFKR